MNKSALSHSNTRNKYLLIQSVGLLRLLFTRIKCNSLSPATDQQAQASTATKYRPPQHRQIYSICREDRNRWENSEVTGVSLETRVWFTWHRNHLLPSLTFAGLTRLDVSSSHASLGQWTKFLQSIWIWGDSVLAPHTVTETLNFWVNKSCLELLSRAPITHDEWVGERERVISEKTEGEEEEKSLTRMRDERRREWER